MQPNIVLSAIVAMTQDRVIGRNKTLPWRLPSDQRRFRDITTGHPVIMGRETWESIPLKFRPLPGRTNIVLTRQPGYMAHGAITVGSIVDACIVALDAPGDDEIFVIGGEKVYQQFFPFVKKTYITIVHTTIDGDAFFPELSGTWSCTDALRRWQWLKDDEFDTSFHMYERISS